jgi:hypothetical protein
MRKKALNGLRSTAVLLLVSDSSDSSRESDSFSLTTWMRYPYSVLSIFQSCTNAWPDPEFVNHGFPAWRAGTTTLFDVPAHRATQAGGIDSWLLKRLKIWTLLAFVNIFCICETSRHLGRVWPGGSIHAQ